MTKGPQTAPNQVKAARFMRLVLVLWSCLLVACAPALPLAVSKNVVDIDDVLGPRNVVSPQAPLRPNDQIAADFMDLEFRMESGQPLPILTRFEGPITVTMTGPVPEDAEADLTALLTRLRNEAGLDVFVVASPAAITIQFASRAELQRLEPAASCFVAPNASSLTEYRAKRGTAALDWRGLTHRERMAIFVPYDTSPQEVRDCLHEEMAQALGPLNDLYRLPDSVFNDDNFQSVLTEFDMLMLRLHYAPDLANGMSRAEVAARLPGLVAALNPGGAYPGGWVRPDTPRAWTDAVDAALGPRGPEAARLPAARRMLTIAQTQGWTDNRLGFAHFALGRLLAPDDPAAAVRSYTAAARVYATLPDDGVHLSHALMQLAALALSDGRVQDAANLSDQALPLAVRAHNAALQASLQLIKVEALALMGRDTEAAALRLDSLDAARYGFGSDQAVQARQAEIASLALRRAEGG